MAYDTHSNFGYGTVGTAPSPATTGTTIVLGTENFADFPDPGTSSSYQYTVWPSGTFPLTSNAEIGSVIGKATAGTLYLSRSAQGTRSITAGDQFAINITKKHFTDLEQYSPQDGWITPGETWTYASADAPTFTVTAPGTLTSKYSSGMRVKLTSGGSVQYYLMTANPTVASGSSTLTLYGGTAYALGTGIITNNFFSFHKAPQGFPLNPSYWTVGTTTTGDSQTNTPTQNTWYNAGSAGSISIPIGDWNVYYYVLSEGYDTTATDADGQVTLSTTGSTESNSAFTSSWYTTLGTANLDIFFSLSKTNNLSLASKTLYYLNYRTTVANMSAIAIKASRAATVIRITSNFL